MAKRKPQPNARKQETAKHVAPVIITGESIYDTMLQSRWFTAPAWVLVIICWLIIPLLIATTAIMSAVQEANAEKSDNALQTDIYNAIHSIYTDLTRYGYDSNYDLSISPTSLFTLAEGTELKVSGNIESFCITGWNSESNHNVKPMNWDSVKGDLLDEGEVLPYGGCTLQDIIATPSQSINP